MWDATSSIDLLTNDLNSSKVDRNNIGIHQYFSSLRSVVQRTIYFYIRWLQDMRNIYGNRGFLEIITGNVCFTCCRTMFVNLGENENLLEALRISKMCHSRLSVMPYMCHYPGHCS